MISWPTQCLEVKNQDPFIIANPKTWAHHHTYGGWGKFFRGLEEEKILGTKCVNPQCGETRLWLPPRCECPDCWETMQWVDAPKQGNIFTWSVVKYPGELFKLPQGTPLISVELEGVCTKLMSWLKDGEPEIGLPVRAVFNTDNPTHSILDLAWVPA